LITVTIQLLPAFILGAITVIAVLCLIFRWFGLKKVRSFYVWVGVLVVLGGAWAFLFPLAINADFSKNGDGAALRQMLIYTTGGVLGVITLGENHRKNSLEKAKNDQEHLRQVHAERRSRYTTAIEQLSNDKASIRLGGVYTLVGLVDEWLSDEKTIPNFEERRKEGQVIINSLCAYIRSSFLLAERIEQLDKHYAKDLQKDFGGDRDKFDADKRTFVQEKSTLEEERQIRQSIIKEIRERLQDSGTPGSWSKFDYDFSNALFFYSTNFMFSYFDAFSNFNGAVFVRSADFSLVTFVRYVHFFETTFSQNADFFGGKFAQDADFRGTKFTQDADFRRTKFTQDADFFRAEFAQDADFSGAEFIQDADFFGGKFAQDADFSEATFAKSASFSVATFKEKPKFEYALDNKTYKARFSHKSEPEDYNFEVSHDSPYKIETEEQEHNGVKFIIPKGTELFDPDEPSDLEDDDES